MKKRSNIFLKGSSYSLLGSHNTFDEVPESVTHTPTLFLSQFRTSKCMGKLSYLSFRVILAVITAELLLVPIFTRRFSGSCSGNSSRFGMRRLLLFVFVLRPEPSCPGSFTPACLFDFPQYPNSNSPFLCSASSARVLSL